MVRTRMRYVAAIDQGTTSTRCLIFDQTGHVVGADQREHRQILPRPGWVEHDPEEIFDNAIAVAAGALKRAELTAADLAACGLANQRETTVVWDRNTGRAVHPAIVWQDTRTDVLCAELAADGGTDRFAEITGLPLATYFAAPKLRWILDHVDGAPAAAARGDLLFGTVDSWLLWRLTGVHATDVTNASRTMLMDLRTLDWSDELCAVFGVPRAMLPQIRSSSEVYGTPTTGPLAGVPIAGVLGDQQAATFGQACVVPGTAKNTYGTGNFLLLNTGTTPVRSRHGLLTTVCYRLGDAEPVYALEGSIAVTGSLVQWLRDNLGLISNAAEVETLARQADDNGGVYMVPAFSGLFAPHWRPDARGVVVGLTRFSDRRHIARAALEAVAFQTREVVEAMQADSGVTLTSLKVDGGMVVNDLLMQLQADILGVPVVRPQIIETTALGAAYAAGLAVGHWSGLEEIGANWAEDRRWLPERDRAWRDQQYHTWGRAVTRSLDWERH